MKESKKILTVLAHPDDESFGMGGTLALYAELGHEIHYICLTRGEAGEVDPEFLENYDSIADLRTAELLCAAEKLGLAHVEFLDYCDSGMVGSAVNGDPRSLINSSKAEVVEKIVKYIREFKPDVVLTFDPQGGYKHPDHIYCHQVTVEAFKKAADESEFPGAGAVYQAGKLLFHFFPRKLFRFVVRSLRLFGVNTSRYGKNKDIDLDEIVSSPDYPPNYTINYRSVEGKKEKAIACHASQVHPASQTDSILGWMFRLWSGDDRFTQAYPEVSEKYRSKDLLS